MNHAALMGVLDRFRDFHHQRGRFTRRQRAIGHPLCEALALDEAHREIMLPLVLANLENRHDTRMIEVGRRLGFDVEAPHIASSSASWPARIILSATVPVEADLSGLEDDTHPAAGELADDLIVAEVADANRRRSIVPDRPGCDIVDAGLLMGGHGGVAVDRGRCRVR